MAHAQAVWRDAAVQEGRLVRLLGLMELRQGQQGSLGVGEARRPVLRAQAMEKPGGI